VKKPNADVRMLVDIETHNNPNVAVCEARFVYVTSDGDVRYPSHDTYGDDTGTGHLEDLRVRAQVNTDLVNDATDWYGADCAYRQPYEVDLEWAKLMVRTLTTLERDLDKIAATMGRPGSFVDYLVRIGTVVGVSSYGWITKRSTRFLVPNEMRWGDADTLRYHLDNEFAIATHRKERSA
jgi:hypothetical protein